MNKVYKLKIKNISDVYDVSIASINDSVSSDDDYTYENESIFTEKTSIDNDCEKDIEREHAKSIVMKLLKTVSVSEMKIPKCG